MWDMSYIYVNSVASTTADLILKWNIYIWFHCCIGMYCVYAFYNDVYTVACWSYNYNYYNSLLLQILLAWASKRGNESEWVI